MENLEWFPMRVTYHRELKMKSFFDSLGIESFVPMRYDVVETKEGRRRMLVSAIHNLIFVHSTRETLTHLKMTRKEFEPLRYMMRTIKSDGGSTSIIRVPDHEMENFMRVASAESDNVIFLRINEGTFAGVEGVIKRIKKNKHVVVQIEGVAAVAIAFVPSSYLSII